MKLRQRRECAKVSLLQYVLGITIIEHDAARNAIQAAIVRLDDCTDRRLIARIREFTHLRRGLR